MKVSVIMGSMSDHEVMNKATTLLQDFGVEVEEKIVSAHRTPEFMYEYAKMAKENGISIIIAGAGGSAHLPGMVAAMTPLPVIGVPVKSKMLSGWDSLLSIVQMPKGVPVATVAINGAENAALLAISILGISNPEIATKYIDYRSEQTKGVLRND